MKTFRVLCGALGFLYLLVPVCRQCVQTKFYSNLFYYITKQKSWQVLYKALLTIQPTSAKAERASNTCGLCYKTLVPPK